MKAYNKDIIRTIKKEKKRFLSIIVISALGVLMLTGLKAACNDTTYSADTFYKSQNLRDIYIQSTLGLTDDDINAIKEIEDIKSVAGFYEETDYVSIDNVKYSALMTSINNDIDTPYVLEGHLPSHTNEIAVTEDYLNQSNKAVGDQIIIEQSEDSVLKEKTYTISAVVMNATDVNAKEGSTSFRSTATTDFTFYIPLASFDTDIYTGVGISLMNSDAYFTYDDAYKDYANNVAQKVLSIKEERELARTNEIKNEAYEEIKDNENEMYEEFNDAEAQLKDGLQALNDAKKKLEHGQKELNTQKEAAIKQINEGKKQIEENKKSIEEGKKQLNENEASLTETKKALSSNKNQIETTLTDLEAQRDTLQAAIDALGENAPNEYIEQLAALKEAIASLKDQLAQINNGLSEIDNGLSQIRTKRAELLSGERVLKEKEELLLSQEKEMYKELDEAQKEIDDGLASYNEGLNEYNENYNKYLTEKSDAIKKLEEAKEEVADIDEAKWYMSTRENLSGYSNIESDMGAVNSLSLVFAIVFLVVAVLISLTTISRMIEEDRGLVGTYQALGFTDFEIILKYIVYVLIACIIGSILGDLLGYIVLPKILFIIFNTMYCLPHFYLRLNLLYAIVSPLIFIVSTLLAVLWTCRLTLLSYPATLMRPKAPKAGSRVLIERVTFLWNKLSFLNKVTARNIFRYKKRLLMTIIGIAGCTALLVCGYGIRDSVNNLMVHQYDEIVHYDLLTVTSKDDFNDFEDLLIDENVSYLPLYLESITLKNSEGKTLSLQLYVIKDETDTSDYISINTFNEEKKVILHEDDVYITKNASVILDFDCNDSISIQDSSFRQYDFKVSGIVDNYLGNAVFMSQSTYEKTFGQLEYNASMIKSNQSLEHILQSDYILSSVETQTLKEEFSTSFALMNMVVYVLICLSAALAFVVLFTLSSTNISERERELATIKVLGFFDYEVHSYVNKEILILTIIGIVIGLPIGSLLTNALTAALKMPSLYFVVYIKQISYVYAAVLTFIFAIIVNIIMHKTLDRIDPVEALKSIE